jgi:hypothetical protein
MYPKRISYNIFFLFVALGLVFLPVSSSLAQTDGIPLQKDVWLDSIPNLQSEIRDHLYLPNQITFNLYDSKSATTPIVTQTFATTSPIIPEEEIKWILL